MSDTTILLFIMFPSVKWTELTLNVWLTQKVGDLIGDCELGTKVQWQPAAHHPAGRAARHPAIWVAWLPAQRRLAWTHQIALMAAAAYWSHLHLHLSAHKALVQCRHSTRSFVTCVARFHDDRKAYSDILSGGYHPPLYVALVQRLHIVNHSEIVIV